MAFVCSIILRNSIFFTNNTRFHNARGRLIDLERSECDEYYCFEAYLEIVSLFFRRFNLIGSAMSTLLLHLSTRIRSSECVFSSRWYRRSRLFSQPWNLRSAYVPGYGHVRHQATMRSTSVWVCGSDHEFISAAIRVFRREEFRWEALFWAF